jgi:hypothetical protein
MCHQSFDQQFSSEESMNVSGGNPLVDIGGSDRYRIDNIDDFRQSENRRISLILNGRGGRIRTSDPLVPNQIQPLIEIG